MNVVRTYLVLVSFLICVTSHADSNPLEKYFGCYQAALHDGKAVTGTPYKSRIGFLGDSFYEHPVTGKKMDAVNFSITYDQYAEAYDTFLEGSTYTEEQGVGRFVFAGTVRVTEPRGAGFKIRKAQVIDFQVYQNELYLDILDKENADVIHSTFKLVAVPCN